MMCNDKDQTMCDEEKSYHIWVANNLEYINSNKQHVSVMKKLYMEGFAAGFEHKKHFLAQEYLQK